jgi:hypothetical protein
VKLILNPWVPGVLFIFFAMFRSYTQCWLIFDLRLKANKLEYTDIFEISTMIFLNCGIGEIIEMTQMFSLIKSL